MTNAAEPAARIHAPEASSARALDQQDSQGNEFWREKLGNTDPFIAENGGAAFIPEGYFGFPVPGAVSREGYEVLEFGTPYVELVETLAAASRQSGCRVVGFHDMTPVHIAERTHLPVQQAELAKCREYDEPFEIVSTGTYNLSAPLSNPGNGGPEVTVSINYGQQR